VSGAVVVVGSLNVDLVVRVPRLPRPGETVTGGDFSRVQGGKGANAAAAAARLGARTWIVGSVGRDDLAAETLGDLESRGVDVSQVARGERHTGVAAILVDHQAENLIAVAGGANHELSAAHVDGALEAIDARGAVVVANLEIPEEAVEAAARSARERGWPFLLNPAPARTVPATILSLCDVLTPNQHEVTQLGPQSVDGLLEAGVGSVVVTEGSAGASIHRAGESPIHQDAFPVAALDTTGAGDAFSATLAWALSDGWPLEDAVRAAAAGGALATRGVGARSSLATLDELLALASSAP
jgi:ribokinase